MIVGAFELGVVPLPRPGHLADVCVDQRGDRLDAVVEHADRGHGLAELLWELPNGIEVFPEVVAHVFLKSSRGRKGWNESCSDFSLFLVCPWGADD